MFFVFHFPMHTLPYLPCPSSFPISNSSIPISPEFPTVVSVVPELYSICVYEWVWICEREISFHSQIN
jgi:hypothetical protein